MTAEKAASIYEKLKPFLRAISPWDYYLPPRIPGKGWGMKHQHDWPLSDKPGYPVKPLAVTWNPKRQGRPITFDEFLRVYKIPITEAP